MENKFFFGFWLAFESNIITQLVIADLPENLRNLPSARLNLIVNDIRNLVSGNIVSHRADANVQAAAVRYQNLVSISHAAMAVVALTLAIAGGTFTLTRIRAEQRARNVVEAIFTGLLIVCSSIAILTTIGIVLSVLFESLIFFRSVPVSELLFGLEWSSQTAIRADQVGSSGAFGAVPLFAGTLLISFIAMLVAVPIGLMSAIYLAEYAGPRVRASAKPLLEILAGIPTVVYGFFAALIVAPFVRDSGSLLGLDVASESALAAGLVMGIMIIPFVSSLSDDVINAVESGTTIDVTGILADSFVEGPETVEITLTGITASDPGITIDAANDSDSIDILDGDAATVSIAGTTDGNEAGPVDGVFTVTQSTTAVSDTVVSYSVAGTATEGTDYAALSGSVTIPAGQSMA